MAPSKPLRWGIIALGNIARKFTKDLVSQGLHLQAVASRDAEKARIFAAEFGAKGANRAYGSYEALLADSEVDVVYIAAPNHLHIPLTLAAARAGKHVLCEKPFSPDPKVAEAALREVEACGVFFMEAFMYRCHPWMARVRNLLDAETLGEIRLIEARFSYDLGARSENIRLNPEIGGGGFLDVGCYCVNFARFVAGTEPRQARALAHIGASSGVDEWMTASLAFPSGALASLQCAAKVGQPAWAAIYGERGRIEIPQPWHAPAMGAEVRLITPEGQETFLEGDGLTMYGREALAVETAIDQGKREAQAMPWGDTLGQAAAMAALRQSAGIA